jgi:hypothetical protein
MNDDLNLDELAEKVFYVKHIYTNTPIELDPECKTNSALLIAELHDLDVVAIKNTNGKKIVRRQSLINEAEHTVIGQLATDTPREAWINYNATLRETLQKLNAQSFLFVESEGKFKGVVNRQNLGNPMFSAYLLTQILDLERSLRRLYGSYTGQAIADEPRPRTNLEHNQLTAEDIPNDTFYTTKKRIENCPQLREDLKLYTKKKAKSILQRIKDLRDHLAHARSILEIGDSIPEVLGRIDELESLTSMARNLLQFRAAVWDAYANTKIFLKNDQLVVLAGTGAGSLPMQPPVHIISAQNPYEQYLGETENKRRTEILGQYLQLCPSTNKLERVVARSSDPNATWEEDSWAVSGLSREQAVNIANLFRQRAIFELNHDETHIINENNSIATTIPRRAFEQ